LHKSASARPSVCLAIPAFAASLGTVTDTNCNLGCAYANEFAVAVAIDTLSTIAEEVVGFYEGP